ncbi:hypothetical protein FJZ33_00690, partial [Candidatus Poribacteria bacterium]|nr:hypothetical protein [Candidatus Poribacteria bacterium]
SPPEKRKLCLSFSTDINVPQAQKGEAYFKGFQYDMRLLSNAYAIFQPMLSINPKIRTKDDVIGKRVSSSGPKGSTRSAIVEYSLNAWGIMDKVKYQYIDIPETKDAMVDGFIDVSGAAAYIKPAVPYRLDPKLEELVATKTVYLIHLSREDWAAYQPKAEYKFDWGMVPKNAIRPGMPEEEKGSIRLTNGWFAPIDMDPKITYEIAKFISQRHKDIEKQFPVAACTYREMQATGIWTEDLIHPGALKWYKEAGIKIGR